MAKAESICSVDDCPSAAKKRGWCGKHYLRWYKYGDPTTLLPRFDDCQIDGCDKKPRSSRAGLCEMHYMRNHRHGDPHMVVDTRKETCLYRGAHLRIARERGKADQFPCLDCGRQAAQWSYNHEDANEMLSSGGQPYSMNVMNYDPRCVSCHMIFDEVRWNQFTGPNPARR